MYKAYIASLGNKKIFRLGRRQVIKPRGEDADALAKGDNGGSDEELWDGREDGDDHQGQKQVLALVQSSQDGGRPLDLLVEN